MQDYHFQYPELAETLYEAFVPDPFYVALKNGVHGDEAMKKLAMMKYFDYSMVEEHRYGEIYMPESDGYGISIWTKPVESRLAIEKKKAKKQFLLDQLGEDSLNIYLSITDFMNKKAEQLISAEAWYLSIVAVKPAFQGKGLGGSLILPVLEQTDKLSIPTYLETYTPRNMKFYERLGYETIATYDEPITGAPYSIMLRK